MAYQTEHPGLCHDVDDVGTLEWSNPNWALVSNNAWATAESANAQTHYLWWDHCGFTIPLTATINGIKVAIERHALADGGAEENVRDAEVKLVRSDETVIDDNRALTENNWEESDTIIEYGGETDKMGYDEVIPADINDDDFGVVLSAAIKSVTSNTAYVDACTITIYYTEAGGAKKSQTVWFM